MSGEQFMDDLRWRPANLASISRRFESMPPAALLRWALTVYGDDIVLATGFGPAGIVLMDIVSRIRPGTTVFYLQTDLFFSQTLALRDKLTGRFSLNFVEVRAELTLSEQEKQYGHQLWKSNPDLCCRLRKVNPLRRFLADRRAWITGIRRDHGPTRAETQVVSWDHANRLVKLAPLAAWTRAEVWRHIHANHLPYNDLHDEGYPSIGCWPCTQPVTPGGGERDGRWAGFAKLECGIHTNVMQSGPL